MIPEDSYPKQYLYRRVVRAKLFIDAHYSAPIDLDNVADEACFSKFHFTRLFKKICGKTPHHYLTDVRIRRAKELLSTDTPVARVCFSVGFDSISSFTGLFKRRVGLTPAAFQKRSLMRKSETFARPLKFVPNCFVDNSNHDATPS